MKYQTVAWTMLIVLLFCAGLAAAQPYHYYKIDLEYRLGEATVNSVTVEPSQKEMAAPVGLYIAEVVSFDNQILNVTFFDIPLLVLYDTIDPETKEINGGGQFYLNETNVTVYIPYDENAVEINIYDWNLTRLTSIDVKEYAQGVAGEAGKEAQPPIVKPYVETKEEMERWRREAKARKAWKTAWISLGVLAGIAIIIWLWRTRKK
ncbi:hypothetical protein HYS47_05705 [Candidatus Woesearchaeota archaeon]|nr:hypothetical protein [Candidatus Woesearchaeota archaeon]